MSLGNLEALRGASRSLQEPGMVFAIGSEGLAFWLPLKLAQKGVGTFRQSAVAARDSVSKPVVQLMTVLPTDVESVSGAKVDCRTQGTTTLDQAVTELFKRLRDPVYRYLVVVVQDPSLAEEITQEAFLRLYCCLRDGKAIKSVRPWIFRVAHNLALNEKTKRRLVSSEESITQDGLRPRPQSGLPDPEQTLLQQERMHLAMLQLSRHQRECLILRFEGFRYREIAEILGLSVPNVAQSLRRGINKLRELA